MLLWAALALLFWGKGLYSRFRAMGFYLAFRAFFTPILFLTLHEKTQPWGLAHHALLGEIYTAGFTSSYLVAVVLLFFVCIEVFRDALAPFPAIAKFAIVIFRWAAIVAMVVSLASTTSAYVSLNLHLIVEILYNLMHSVSVLMLCLLAFLCLSMNALRLTVRNLSSGRMQQIIQMTNANRIRDS